MAKKIIPFLILLFLIINPLNTLAANINVAAKGCLLMDLDSGEILYSKNINEKFAPASTTKIMTALITLEKCKLDEKVIVGKNPPYEDGTKIYLIEGEELTVKQLLYAMMIESANDAALALAEHISGSKEAFAKLMNEKAIQLGCKNTHFVNPNGLYDDNHYTCAMDLAIIARKAMENPIFREIVATKSYQIPPTNKQSQTRYILNHNKLLTTRGYIYEGANGVKTGYTIKARHTFVGSANRNGMNLLVVFLNSDKTYYSDAKKLFDYGFNYFTTKKIISKDEPVTHINVENNISIPVYCENDYFVTLPKSDQFDFNKKIVLNSSYRSIVRGQVIGYVEISDNENNIKNKINLIAGGNYDFGPYVIKSQDNSNYKKVLIKKYLYIPIGIFFSLFIARGFYNKYKKRSGRI